MAVFIIVTKHPQQIWHKIAVINEGQPLVCRLDSVPGINKTVLRVKMLVATIYARMKINVTAYPLLTYPSQLHVTS